MTAEDGEGTSAAAADDEQVEQELKRVEEDPPKDLDDWPGGKAKYKTFGGAESESGYGEGPTEKLGPADLQHHPDGSVTIGGEQVDNPEDYKGEPIPGGPTDPNAPPDPGFDSESVAGGGDGGGGAADGTDQAPQARQTSGDEEPQAEVSEREDES